MGVSAGPGLGEMTLRSRHRRIAVPGAAPFHVGIPDYRFSWSGDVKRIAAAPYVVGGADWLALVERLGLRPALKIGPG